MSAPAAAGGFKRKFDSSSKPSSSSHKGKPSGDAPAWKKQRSDGKQQLGWKKKAEWKAGAPKAFTRKDRDQMKKERKAQKPNADIIAEANKVSRGERRRGGRKEGERGGEEMTQRRNGAATVDTVAHRAAALSRRCVFLLLDLASIVHSDVFL